MNKGLKVIKSAQKLAIQDLLKQMQGQSSQIENYNFRKFFERKTIEKITDLETLQVIDDVKVSDEHHDVGEEMLMKYQQEAQQLQRIVVVQNLYCGIGTIKPNIIEDRLKDKKE